MDFLKNQIDDLNLVVTINIKREDVQPLVDNKLKEIRRTCAYPGFRPGATPMSIIQKRFGLAIFSEKLSEYANKQIEEYIKNEKLNVLFQPLIAEDYEPLEAKDFETAEEFNFPFHFGLCPKFDETELYKTKFIKYHVVFGNEIIDKIINGYKQSLGDFDPVDTIGEESMIKVSLVQTDKDKNVIEDGINVESASILLKTLSEENKNLFIGKNLNDELNADIKKIYSHDSEVASILSKTKEEIEKEEELFFNMKIISITDFVLCEINQKMFDYCYGKDVCSTEEEFIARLRADVAENYERDIKSVLAIDVKSEFKRKLDTLIPLPEGFVRRFFELKKEENELELTDETFAENLKYLRWSLLGELVIAKNNITVTEEEIFEYAKIAVSNYTKEQYGYTLPQKQIINYVQNLIKDEKQILEIEHNIKEDKLVDFFISQVELEEKDVTLEELQNIYQEKVEQAKAEHAALEAEKEALLEAELETTEAELADKPFAETAEIIEETVKPVKEKVKKSTAKIEKTVETEDNQTTDEDKPKPKTKKVNKDS